MRRTRRAARREAGAGDRSAPRTWEGAFAGTAGRRLVWTLAAVYAVLFSALCAIKFRYYLYDDFDLAIFVQALEGLLRGTMHSSIRGMNWLGDHSSLNLFLVAPLYAVFRSPLTLLVLQSAVLALGALPVHAAARRMLGDGFPAVACAALYLAYPALGYTSLYEFHPEVLSTTPLLFLLDAVHARRPRAAALWAFLALTGKEDVALVVLGVGLLALLRRGEKRVALGVPLLALGVAFLALTFGVLKPRLAGVEASYGDMYSQWGEGPRGIALGLLRHPVAAVWSLFDTPGDPVDAAAKHWFHLHLLLPLGLLPLLAPLELLPALPVLGEHLLSWRSPQHEISYQYTALLTPTYVFAAIAGLASARRRFARRPAGTNGPTGVWLALWALAAALASQVAFGPLRDRGGLGLPPPRERFAPTSEERVMAGTRDRMLRALPARGTVVASFPYLARLASRVDPVVSAHHVLTGMYTFSRQAFPTPTGVRAAILDATDEFYDDSTAARLRALAGVNRLRPVDVRGSVMRFAADPPDTVEWITLGVPVEETGRSVVFDRSLELLGATVDTVATAGGSITVRTTWRRVGPVDRLALAQLALLDPAGRISTTRPHVLGYLLQPVSGWPEGAGVRETYRWVLDPRLAAGRYQLALRLGWKEADGAVHDAVSAGGEGSAVVDLGSFEVRAR